MAKKYPRPPAHAEFWGWEGESGRRSAEVADILLTQNSAMTIIFVLEKKLLSSRNFFDATIVAAKKYPRPPAHAGFWGWEGESGRRSAEVADISLARNSAMTIIFVLEKKTIVIAEFF